MPQSTSTKRSRQEAEDNRAECPFTIRLVDPKEKELKLKSKKRRKRAHGTNDDDGSNANGSNSEPGSKKILQQCAPFEPKGTFDTHATMDVHYVVEPARQWAEMTRYNSFVLNGIKYYCEGFIFVANDSSIERQKQSGPRDPPKRSEDDWVARILEIRASDEHHVYARVFWMYWPDELPAGTHYGKKAVQGRQPHHGAAELIASNHMDIINVVSVTSAATVNHLIEDRDDETQSALYWRQALDVRNLELSTIEVVCDCNQPANPDKLLVGCGAETCGKWVHEECLKHYALMRVYEQLGKDTPHKSASPLAAAEGGAGAGSASGAAVKPETSKEDMVKEPLSPKETGGAVSAQHSIDVKADTVEVAGAGKEDEDDDKQGVEGEDQDTYNGAYPEKENRSAAGGRWRRRAETAKMTEEPDTAGNDDVAAGGDASSALRVNGTNETGTELAVRDKTLSQEEVLKREVTPVSGGAGGSSIKGSSSSAAGTPPTKRALAAAASSATTPGRGGGSRKQQPYPTLHSFDGKKKPYDRLFEAKLLLGPVESAATMVEIRDLRTNIVGGDKLWLEPAECPVCGSPIG